MYDFKLDFTKSVPFRYCPDTREAAALYIQCVANAPMDIEFRKVKPGLFNVSVDKEADKKRLEGKFVIFDFGEKTHILKSARVPLILLKKRLFYNNPKWITIDKLYDSALRYVKNEQIDAYLQAHGDVIVPTHFETDKFGFKTGRRKIRLDVTSDIERWKEVCISVDIEGQEISAKGRVNFFYKGQPYHCRNCQEQHTDKCPQYVIKQIAEKEAEEARMRKSNTLLVGDSNLRRVNQQAFYARTECAVGAKIGHISNTLDFVKKDEHQVIVCHVGQNNITQDDVNMKEWSKKVQGEVNSLKTNLTKFKSSIVVGVPPAPWCKKSEKTKEMRKTINEALKKISRENMNIRYLDIEQEEDDDEANWEDERHMTEKFTAYVLGRIAEKMQDIQKKPFYVPNIKWTTERKHSQVQTTYKLGCETCTAIGHSMETCSMQQEGAGKKRGTCSGSEESTAKKGKD